MAKKFNGRIELDIRDSEPDWEPYLAPKAPERRAEHPADRLGRRRLRHDGGVRRARRDAHDATSRRHGR